MPHPSVMRKWRADRDDLIAAGFGCPVCRVVAVGVKARAVHVCEHGVAVSPALAASRAEEWLAYETGATPRATGHP